ncbi:MFS transporter [Micrococcus sp. M4NT]|uniref:MFS transporter n=1 Tax=Micrococcus sp. M4NT TaxID=2957501 RepID=UPI0029B43F0F|nr:MFS transporter [Micrococcus sp. M4NT]MDX2340388.1 MFS transporter [Micrococcus sp. M4NT]
MAPSSHPAVPPAAHDDGPARRSACRLVAANALDAAGRSATDVALDVIAVLALGVGAAEMGVLMTLSGLGFLFLGVPLGILVDRHLSPRLLAGAGLAKGALLGTLVAAWALDALTFAHLAAVMAGLGVLTVLAETTQTTLVPRVTGPDGVALLSARLESADAALGVAVPAAAGLAVGALGAGPVAGLAAALLAAAGLTAATVRMAPVAAAETVDGDEDGVNVPQAEPDAPAAAATLGVWRRFLAEAAEGWTTLRRTPVLWALTLASTVGNVGMALFAPVEAVWILTDLRLGPEFLGFQLTAGAVGALAASAAVGRALDRLGERTVLVVGSAGCVVAVGLLMGALVDRAHAPAWLLAGNVAWGFFIVLGNVTQGAVFARACSPGALGRVTAMRRTLSRGSVPPATLLGGIAGSALGVGWVLGAWLALAVAGLGMVLLAVRHLRGAADGPR